jgi:hypothetical protein
MPGLFAALTRAAAGWADKARLRSPPVVPKARVDAWQVRKDQPPQPLHVDLSRFLENDFSAGCDERGKRDARLPLRIKGALQRLHII